MINSNSQRTLAETCGSILYFYPPVLVSSVEFPIWSKMTPNCDKSQRSAENNLHICLCGARISILMQEKGVVKMTEWHRLGKNGLPPTNCEQSMGKKEQCETLGWSFRIKCIRMAHPVYLVHLRCLPRVYRFVNVISTSN